MHVLRAEAHVRCGPRGHAFRVVACLQAQFTTGVCVAQHSTLQEAARSESTESKKPSRAGGEGRGVGRALPIMGPKTYSGPPLQRCEGASPQPKPIIKPFCSIFDHGKSARPLDSTDSVTSTESWSGGPQLGGSFLRSSYGTVREFSS